MENLNEKIIKRAIISAHEEIKANTQSNNPAKTEESANDKNAILSWIATSTMIALVTIGIIFLALGTLLLGQILVELPLAVAKMPVSSQSFLLLLPVILPCIVLIISVVLSKKGINEKPGAKHLFVCATMMTIMVIVSITILETTLNLENANTVYYYTASGIATFLIFTYGFITIGTGVKVFSCKDSQLIKELGPALVSLVALFVSVFALFKSA